MALRNLFPNSYDFPAISSVRRWNVHDWRSPFSSKLFLLVHVRKTEDTNGELSKMEGCVLERRENKRRKREEKQLNWEKVFDRMHDERRQLCCCFDLAVHYRVHLGLWFCDRNIVHEEKERTQKDYVENAKWNEKFPIECEQPVLLWFLLWWRGRGGRFRLILGQDVLERVQHFDSAKGYSRVVWK